MVYSEDDISSEEKEEIDQMLRRIFEIEQEMWSLKLIADHIDLQWVRIAECINAKSSGPARSSIDEALHLPHHSAEPVSWHQSDELP